jgi:hypothetical protein
VSSCFASGRRRKPYYRPLRRTRELYWQRGPTEPLGASALPIAEFIGWYQMSDSHTSELA